MTPFEGWKSHSSHGKTNKGIDMVHRFQSFFIFRNPSFNVSLIKIFRTDLCSDRFLSSTPVQYLPTHTHTHTPDSWRPQNKPRPYSKTERLLTANLKSSLIRVCFHWRNGQIFSVWFYILKPELMLLTCSLSPVSKVRTLCGQIRWCEGWVGRTGRERGTWMHSHLRPRSVTWHTYFPFFSTPIPLPSQLKWVSNT